LVTGKILKEREEQLEVLIFQNERKEFFQEQFWVLFSVNFCLNKASHAQRYYVTHYCVRYMSREAWSSLRSFGKKWHFLQKSANYRFETLSRIRESVEQGANCSPTVSIALNRMAMTTERSWTNFRILCRVYGFGLKGRIYVPVILAISILYCYGKPYRRRV